MGYRRRIYFTEKQKSEIRDRWQRGEAMSSIGHLFDRSPPSIYPLSARTGCIRPAGLVICGRLLFCKRFLERRVSKQVAVICPAC